MVRGGFAVIMTRNIGMPSLGYQTSAGGIPSQGQLLSGFAETSSHYLCEVQPGGGSESPEPAPETEAVLFILDGSLDITLDNTVHRLKPGDYAYTPPGRDWAARNDAEAAARSNWIRMEYERVEGIGPAEAFFTNERDLSPLAMPDTDGRWATTRFVDLKDIRHNMRANIVTLEPGASIPFMETRVIKHGLHVLERKAVYRLNQSWVDIETGDYIWLRAFCPQACYLGGLGKFRYLLYKNIKRHMPLTAER